MVSRFGTKLSVLAVLILLPLALLTAACASMADLEAGDCVARSEEGSFSPADCDDPNAEFQVLERIDEPGESCYDVPGVTDAYRVSRGPELCIGPRNVDPATAVNTAQPGDCLTEINQADPDPRRQSVRRVDCASPEAVYRVLDRVSGSSLKKDECASTPGTVVTYSWWLHSDNAIAGIQSERVFCLIPKDMDPQASPDLAQVGDCLGTTDRYNELVRVDCGDPKARYRVLHRDDNALLGGELACRGVRGTVSTYQKPKGDFKAYALCLGSV